MQEGSLYSTPSPTCTAYRFFWWWPYWLVMSHCSFDLHFSDKGRCWASFHVFIGHLYVFMSFAHSLIGLFVFLLLSCISCLYILEINPLLALSFAIIFSHSEVCCFALFSFLCCAKAFKFNYAPPVCFVFISVTLKGGSQRILLWFMSESILPKFSSKSFIVSSSIFRSLVHF